MLSVEGLCGIRIHDMTLSVRAGEITGMAGDRLPPGDMVTAIERGVAFVPADRHRLGAVMSMSMRENLTLPALRGRPRRFGPVWHSPRRRSSTPP